MPIVRNGVPFWHLTRMGKLYTITSDEQTDLRVLRFRLRKVIEADEAAILVENDVPGSFRGAKYIGSVTREAHRDTAIKELSRVELKLSMKVGVRTKAGMNRGDMSDRLAYFTARLDEAKQRAASKEPYPRGFASGFT